MKKYFVLGILIPIAVLSVSCTENFLTQKKITIEIPEHPWEEEGKVELWYSVKWNNGSKIESLYVDSETRNVEISVSRRGTVFICAYPLGDMLPFGAAVLPTESKSYIELNQNDGYIAHLLLNIKPEVAEHVNYAMLREVVLEKTADFRTVNDTVLIADVLNGRLDKNSVEIRSGFKVESMPIPNGRWVPEYETDTRLNVTENRTGELEFTSGVYRYYCSELDREFRLVIDENGGVFYSLRYGMIGL